MLTDADCKNAFCPPDRKQKRFYDTGGLYLQVSPADSKRWWKYRMQEKEKQMALGNQAATMPTSGYGHVALVHEQDKFATGIRQAEATELLHKDVRIAERAVLLLISVPLTDGQFDALVPFVFNLGAGALQRSTLRLKVNRGEHESVPAELMKWVWAAGKKHLGLVCRRQTEGACYD